MNDQIYKDKIEEITHKIINKMLLVIIKGYNDLWKEMLYKRQHRKQRQKSDEDNQPMLLLDDSIANQKQSNHQGHITT